MEAGYCVTGDSADQNSGVIKLTSNVDENTAVRQADCLELCKAVSGATGCELIWNHHNVGCYAHTEEIARGNGIDNHGCWVFSKCSGTHIPGP